jgi:hypothetical protein
MSDACTINVSRTIIEVGASHTDDSRGIIYNPNLFIIQATGRVYRQKGRKYN